MRSSTAGKLAMTMEELHLEESFQSTGSPVMAAQKVFGAAQDDDSYAEYAYQDDRNRRQGPIFVADYPPGLSASQGWDWDVLLAPNNHGEEDQYSDGGYVEAATPLSPSTPSIASTPRFAWAGEELGLGVQSAFYKISGPRREQIDELLKLLDDAKADRSSQKVGELLQLHEFWDRLEKLEGSFLEEEDLDAVDVDIVDMLRDLHKELRAEQVALDKLLENVRYHIVLFSIFPFFARLLQSAT
jgi:hypothetical protein